MRTSPGWQETAACPLITRSGWGFTKVNNCPCCRGLRLNELILGWLLFHRRQWRECALLMEKLLVAARKESPHQADYARRLMGLARSKMQQ